MTCDWDSANAIDTFFEQPEGYSVEVFDNFDDFIAVFQQQELTLRGCRNPVKRTLGFHCPDTKQMWMVNLRSFVETEHPVASRFSNRLEHAKLAEELSANEVD